MDRLRCRTPNREIVAEQLAKIGFEEFEFGLQLQTATRHNPADAVGDFGNQTRSGDDRQQTFATAGCRGADDAFERALAGAQGVAEFSELILMATKHDAMKAATKTCCKYLQRI